jgi:hypothetical protein
VFGRSRTPLSFVISQGNYGWKCGEANQRAEMVVGRF